MDSNTKLIYDFFSSLSVVVSIMIHTRHHINTVYRKFLFLFFDFCFSLNFPSTKNFDEYICYMNLCIRKVWVAININTAWIYTELCTALTVVYIKNINFKITLMPSNSMLSESLNGYNVYTLKRQIFPKNQSEKINFLMFWWQLGMEIKFT